MCGIAGLLGVREGRKPLEAMAETLRHRGPDAGGVWEGEGAVLGHRRLSILDLSEAGTQPMVLGDLVLVYNGEIYNYRALREELEGPFRSETDSEVLLRLFARDGPACLGALRGMYAFAVWDRRRRTLFAARDPLGIKPLYWTELAGGGFAFASEEKALLALGPRSPDPSAVVDVFTYKYVPSPKSIWQGIHALEPGHRLVWDGKVRTERHWRPRSQVSISDPGEARERFAGLLREAVRGQTVADVPVGVFLSGGLDSTALVAQLDAPATFTVGFEGAGREDAAHARQVSERFSTRHHEERLGALDLAEAVEAVPRLHDGPFGDSSAWPTRVVSEAARRHVTVALSGEGGDELLSGYGRYGRWLASRPQGLARLAARVLPPFSAAGRSLHRRGAADLPLYDALASAFPLPQKRALLAPDLVPRDYDHLWALRRHWRDDLPPVKRLQWLDLHTYLPDDLLTKVDRASMSVSLEVRPPLLDVALVEFALALDPSLLRRDGTDKWILRRTLEGVAPAGVLSRRKQGFSMPVRRWAAGDPGRLRGAVSRLAALGILRSARPPRLGGEQIWSLLVLDRWSQGVGTT